MSYILDALKKSDQERPREAAGIPLHEVPAFRVRPRRIRWSTALIAGVLIAGGGGAAFWMSLQGAGPAPSERSSVLIPVEAGHGAVVPVTSPSVTPPVANADTRPPVTGTVSAAPEQSAAATREGLLELWQLTEAEQKYLQGLDVSFHVYSTDPAKRAVIINGLRAGEGQALGEDLRLADIVPDGIVLEFQGQFVHLANPQPY